MTSPKNSKRTDPCSSNIKKEELKSVAPAPSATRIMIVDDSATMRRLIRNQLEKIGVKNIIEAENGLRGLEKLENNRVDIIIADWLMPRMNGAVMVKEIRKNPDYDNIPIVLVSAEYGEKINKAIKAGANGYLNKPFNLDDLKQILTKFISDI